MSARTACVVADVLIMSLAVLPFCGFAYIGKDVLVDASGSNNVVRCGFA